MTPVCRQTVTDVGTEREQSRTLIMLSCRESEANSNDVVT